MLEPPGDTFRLHYSMTLLLVKIPVNQNANYTATTPPYSIDIDGRVARELSAGEA